MKCSKRILAMLLALVMVVALLPASVFASDPGPGELVTIYYTNDVHTYIDQTLNYAAIAELKDAKEERGENVMLIDAGDHIQGTAYGGMDNGATMVKLMNAAGYDLATLGNHEFDYSMSGTLKTIADAEYPYVSCNFLQDTDKDGTFEPVLDAYKIFTFGEYKIAFVGITTPESFTKSTPKYFQDDEGNYIYDIIGGTDGTALYEAVQASVDMARAEHVDYVIAVAHLGDDPASDPWNSEDVIAATTGIDAVIDGHSHSTVPMETVQNKDGKDVVLTQTGYHFNAIGEMTIGIDGTISTKLLTKDSFETIPCDETVDALEKEWIQQVNDELGTEIAETDTEFTVNYKNTDGTDGNRAIRSSETNLGDLNADAYYWFAQEAGLEPDLAIMNGGGIRSSVPAGSWTYNDCKKVNTFGNALCILEISGQQLLDALEFGARFTTGDPDQMMECGGFLQVAGCTYKIELNCPNTVQIDEKNVWIGGPTGRYRVYDVKIYNRKTGTYEALELEKTYRICGATYTLYNCGDGCRMFDGGKHVLDGISMDYLALASYVAAFKDTDGDGLGNIATENSPLAAYPGYLLNYESYTGAGRIELTKSLYFSDLSEDQYYAKYASTLGYKGIIAGTATGIFGAEDTMTRAMAMTMLYRMAGKPSPEKTGDRYFTDVPAGSYYSNAVGWAYEMGLTSGTSAKTFSPNQPITREMFAAFLYRYYQKIDGAFTCPLSDNDPDAAAAADWDTLSPYAQTPMRWAVDVKVIYGTRSSPLTLAPKATMTRAMGAAMLGRYIELPKATPVE